MSEKIKAVLGEFTSPENINYLRKQVIGASGDARIRSYVLSGDFEMDVCAYARIVEREISTSALRVDKPIYEFLKYYNGSFINYKLAELRAEYADTHSSIVYDSAPVSLSRNRPNGRMKTDDILHSWKTTAGNPLSMRDDPNEYGTVPLYNRRCTYESPSVEFCDQEHVGLQRHLRMYEDTEYKRNLNGTEDNYANYAFGVSNPYTDARLLSRRIFNNNERGEEGGIKIYRAAIERRHYDPDVRESLPGRELGYMERPFDMRGIDVRMSQKKNNICVSRDRAISAGRQPRQFPDY